MIKNKKKWKKLPETTKFSTLDNEDSDDILFESLMGHLVLNGCTLDELLKSVGNFESESEKTEMSNKISNILLDFLNLNPEFISILKKNDEASKIYKFLGISDL